MPLTHSAPHSTVALNQVLTSPIRPFLEAVRDSALVRQSDVNIQRNHSSFRMQQDIEVEARQGRGGHIRAQKVSRRGGVQASIRGRGRGARGVRGSGSNQPHSHELPASTSQEDNNCRQVVIRNPFLAPSSNTTTQTELTFKIAILPRHVSFTFHCDRQA